MVRVWMDGLEGLDGGLGRRWFADVQKVWMVGVWMDALEGLDGWGCWQHSY